MKYIFPTSHSFIIPDIFSSFFGAENTANKISAIFVFTSASIPSLSMNLTKRTFRNLLSSSPHTFPSSSMLYIPSLNSIRRILHSSGNSYSLSETTPTLRFLSLKSDIPYSSIMPFNKLISSFLCQLLST